MTLPVYFFPRLDSTMERARAIARDMERDRPAIDAFWVRAGHQTAGRGRRERSWEDRPGESLLVTLAVRRGGSLDPGDAVPGTLALRSAAAVYSALCHVLPPVDPEREILQIKWPNDVLLRDRKVSGILLEADPRWFLIGLGLNVRGAPSVSGSSPVPTSLAYFLSREDTGAADAGGTSPPSPEDIFPALEREMLKYLAGEDWYGLVSRVLAWRDREVAVEVDGRRHRDGVIQGITRDGALMVGSPAEPVYSGTVRLK